MKLPQTDPSHAYLNANVPFYQTKSYQTKPNQLTLHTPIEYLFSINFYPWYFLDLGPLFIVRTTFLMRSQKKNTNCRITWSKTKNSNFSGHHLKVDLFSDIFCFLTKKIQGDSFWDICPSRFEVLPFHFFFWPQPFKTMMPQKYWSFPLKWVLLSKNWAKIDWMGDKIKIVCFRGLLQWYSGGL